ncbi:response regulator [Fulvivirgaceae bacterium BMA10]|uniref:Response regulator n=1 Tax=Splendidivirga corallicola TaxID=3051826 RepID=A0ABT8KK09_9BACT|nr:response regulator [Fulvivirgaceae bacterium BMA10]
MPTGAIVCIDDEKLVLDSLKVQLREGFGNEFLLEFAQDAQEGFEVIDELFKDGVNVLTVVCDWLMPGMKGDEFLIEIHKRHPKIIKIMLTGQIDHKAIERAKNEANLFSCLNKPWDKQELLDTIRLGLQKL